MPFHAKLLSVVFATEAEGECTQNIGTYTPHREDQLTGQRPATTISCRLIAFVLVLDSKCSGSG